MVSTFPMDFFGEDSMASGKNEQDGCERNLFLKVQSGSQSIWFN